MALLTHCPACGAPIEYAGNEDMVNCAFCGAQIKIKRVDGEDNYQVLAQPEPQKEVLSNPVDVPPGPEENFGGAAQVYGETQDYGQSLFDQPVSGQQPMTPPPPRAFDLPPTPAVGEVVNPTTMPTRSGGVTRWIIIGAAVVIGGCLLLACLAGVLLLYNVRMQ